MDTRSPNPPSLVDEVADPGRLGVALATVVANAGRRGNPGARVHQQLADPTALLDRLHRQLSTRTYRGDPLTVVGIDKEGKPGNERALRLPSLPDKVVESALASILSERVDPFLSPLSFAYRRGIGTADALRAASAFGRDGLEWAVRADISTCFDSIPHWLVLQNLDRFGADPDMIELVRRLLTRPDHGRRSGQLRPERGLPQGAPLSPLLANIALDELDRRIADRGLPMIRFSDDLLIPVARKGDRESVLIALGEELDALGLAIQPEKTETMSFQEGFMFLGRELDNRRSERAETRPSDKATIYLAKQGTTAVIRKGRIQVLCREETLLDVPQREVERIVAFGPVGISGGLRQWALNSGTELVFLSLRGKLLGVTQSGHSRQVQRRVAQYDLLREREFAESLGRAFIAGKIANSRALLRRRAHQSPGGAMSQAITSLGESLARMPATSADSLMGVEGAAAHTYWSAFRALLPEQLGFEGRKYRPAPDVVNAALSMLYTLLTGEAVGALAAAGLDPALGALHRPQDSRPSLALDLIEEFRPLIVDSVVLEMAGRGMLEAAPATADPQTGVRLQTKSLRQLFQRYEARMTTVVHHVPSGMKCSYRRALHLQAESVARCIKRQAVTYQATGWRV